MPFEVKILGSNSASPVYNRHQSAQILNIQHQLFLIDCGEATQSQLLKYKIKYNKINHIFISHLHGDHYLGLIGLISTMHLNGRQTDLYIYGPPGLSEIITIQFKFSETVLNYKIILQELDTEKIYTILDLENLSVETIPLKHRIKCCGFLFREKPKKRKINKEKIPANLSLQNIIALKEGNDVIHEEGNLLLKFEDVTLPPKKSRSFAYCSDTMYFEQIIPQISQVDLLYHESTFMSDLKDRAAETYHSTAFDAGTIAKKAQVNKLIIGHFSSRYRELEPLLAEAKRAFQNAYLAIEGEDFIIPEE